MSVPESKKVRLSSTQMESPLMCDETVEGGGEGSPAGPSSARSSNGSIPTDEDIHTGNIIEFISKNLLGGVLKMDQLPTMILTDSLPPHTPVPTSTPIPGAMVVSQMPTSQLFANDDWSWHRNPAASIRSGGTNKQTPVWKYFVYDKTENLSRCIVSDCTYQLKGPHTSTLACHLKKHPNEYAEFQKLKSDYSKDRNGGHLPPSPASSSGGSTTSAMMNSSTPSSTPQTTLSNHNNNNNFIMDKDQRHKSSLSLQQSLSTPPPPPFNQVFPFSLFPNPSNASSVLLQHGMSIGPQGQLVLTKKWRKEERKQREMEQRLCLFISSARLPSTVLFDLAFREMLENAQPKFTCPDDAVMMEQMISGHYSRLQMALRQEIHSSRRLSLLIDVIAVPCSASHRMTVTAAILTPLHSIDQLLLAVRQLDGDSMEENIQRIMQQVIAEYGISMDKVSRIVTSGFHSLNLKESKILGPKQLDSYKPVLLEAFLSVVEHSERMEEVKKSFYAMIMALVSQQGLIQTLSKTVGHPVNLPFTHSFFPLLEAVLSMKNELITVLLGAGIDSLSPDQWRTCEILHSLFSRLQSKSDTIETLDTVVPSLMQMIVSIDKDSTSLGPLADELRDEIGRCCSSILDVHSDCLDESYILSTSLNPQLVLLLDDDQISYAKDALEKEVHDNIRVQDEAATRKRPYLSLDNLLATVIDRANGMSGGEGEGGVPPTSILYPDLIQAAQLKKKNMVEGSTRTMNRFAEAIVQTYFDEITQNDVTPSASFTGRHLPVTSFWHSNAHRCPQLAEIALLLTSVPSCTPGAETIFSYKDSTFDPLSLHILPDRLERDTLLRFNRSRLPRSF